MELAHSLGPFLTILLLAVHTALPSVALSPPPILDFSIPPLGLSSVPLVSLAPSLLTSSPPTLSFLHACA